MKKIPPVILAVICVAMFCSSMAQTSYDIVGRADFDTLSIPVKTVPDGKWGSLIVQAKPTMVRSGGRYTERFKQAITVYKDASSKSVVLVIDLTLLNKPGTYEVEVALATDTMQYKTFTLVRPAATLANVNPVSVVISGNSRTEGPLELEETGGLSGIESLVLTAPCFQGINKGDLISFSDTIQKLPAGRRHKIVYTFNPQLLKDLPLGETTGKMLVEAPEMSKPVEVSFSIINKRSAWWIFGTVVVGLLMGTFVRHVLQSRRDIEEARMKGLEVTRQIQAKMEGLKDEAFRQEVAAILDELMMVLSVRRNLFRPSDHYVTEMTDKTTAALNKYNSARSTFDERLKVIGLKLSKISALFNEGTNNSEVKAILDTVRHIYAMFTEAVANKNPTKAEEHINELISRLNSTGEFWEAFQLSLIGEMEKDVFYPEAIPSDLKRMGKAHASKIKELLQAINYSSKDESEILEQVRKSAMVSEAKRTVVQAVQDAGASVYKVPPALVGSDVAKRVEVALLSWNTFLNKLKLYAVDNNMGYNVEEQEKLVLELNVSWAAIKDKLGNVLMEKAIDGQGNVYWNMPALRPFTPSEYFDKGGSGVIAIGMATNLSENRWLRITLIQAAILTIFIGLGAVQLYSSKFIGKTDELISIFLFAFSLDIAVGSISKVSEKRS